MENENDNIITEQAKGGQNEESSAQVSVSGEAVDCDTADEVFEFDESGEIVTDADTPEDEEPAGEKSAGGFILNVYEAASVIVSAFVMLALLFTFVFRLVGVEGYSMENTVTDGDWVITTQKVSYKYGDIVVITQDNAFHKPLIKRVIATGGQTIDINYTTSTVYVDGVPLDEPYRKEAVMEYDYTDVSFPYVVPDGCLFVMGDNRNNSSDSRSNLVGPIDERYILGRAAFRMLPFGDFDIYNYE